MKPTQLTESAVRVAAIYRRLGSGTRLRLFHGTAPKYVSSIRSKGLVSKNYGQAEWYVLATDFESALFHATADKGGDAYVVEFEVEVEREPWYGFPHLWPPYKRGSGSWFALKTPLDPKMIRKVHKVPYDEFAAQKLRGF